MNGKEPVQEPDTLLPLPSSDTAGQGPERARASGLELKWPHCYERRRLRESKGSKWSVDKREGSHLKQKELKRKQLKKTEGRLLLAINGEEMRVQKGGIPALATIPGAETPCFGLLSVPSSTLANNQGHLTLPYLILDTHCK